MNATSHLPLLPVLLPLVAGALLLVVRDRALRAERVISLLAASASLVTSVLLVRHVDDGGAIVHRVGELAPGLAITLRVDRLGALMLLLTDVVALAAIAHACFGDDKTGPHLHALLQFQIAGLHGAFVTNDLFNVFVFFEILLIASYALLLHGRTRARVRAGMPYVLVNLAGSTLFLVAIASVYGLLGALDLDTLAARAASAPAEVRPLVRVAVLLLLFVFALKSALVPLHLWLPRAYAAAPSSIAALFALLTKVGVYALVRTAPIASAAAGGNTLFETYVLPLALLSQWVGFGAAIGTRHLGRTLGHLLVGSVGVMVTGIAIGTKSALAAALVYLAHSTVTVAAAFLVRDGLLRARPLRDSLARSRAPRSAPVLGAAFFAVGVAAAGAPPFAGFWAKAWLLRGAVETPLSAAVFATVLGSGLLALVACVRAGIALFWNVDRRPAGGEADTRSHAAGARPVLAPALSLVVALFAYSVAGGPISRYADEAAEELLSQRAGAAAGALVEARR